MLRCYKQGQLAVAVSQSVSQSVSQRTAGVQSCELLLLAEAGGQFENPEEGERPPLEAATKQRQWRHYCGHQLVCNSEL
jgi:hypothetical protein